MPITSPPGTILGRFFGPRVSLEKGAGVTTEVDQFTPWYLRIVNIVIPSFIIGPAVLALLIKLGLVPASAFLFGSMPFSLAVLATIATGTAIAWLGPIILNWIFPRKNQYDPTNDAVRELKRRFAAPSTARSFDWTVRITIAATGFALLAVVIAFFIINPPGAIVGTAVIELIQFSAIPLTIAAGAGALFGIILAAAWRRLALNYVLRTAKATTGIGEQNSIDLEQTKLKDQAPRRVWYLASTHDAPLYFRLAFGVLAGLGIATFASLILMPSGGLGAILFASITVAATSVAVFYPYLGRSLELALGLKDRNSTEELVKVPHPKARFWLEQSILDVPFYVRAFLGLGAGLAIGSMFGGLAVFIAPATGLVMGLASPAFFALLEKAGLNTWLEERNRLLNEQNRLIKTENQHIRTENRLRLTENRLRLLQQQDSSIKIHTPLGAEIREETKEKRSLFAETPHGHSSLDMPWLGRLFNGAGAGAAICAALIALGVSPPVAILVGTSLIMGALAHPLLAAIKRQIPTPRWLEDWLFSPKVQSRHEEYEDVLDESGKSLVQTTGLKYNKLLIYSQWYVRIAVGALVGSLIGLGLGFLANPLLSPIIVISSAVFFWAAQPIYKGLQKLWDGEPGSTTKSRAESSEIKYNLEQLAEAERKGTQYGTPLRPDSNFSRMSATNPLEAGREGGPSISSTPSEVRLDPPPTSGASNSWLRFFGNLLSRSSGASSTPPAETVARRTPVGEYGDGHYYEGGRGSEELGAVKAP